MSELQDVLNSIDSHCSVENRDGYSNLSIGRGEIMMQGLRAPICDETYSFLIQLEEKILQSYRK